MNLNKFKKKTNNPPTHERFEMRCWHKSNSFCVYFDIQLTWLLAQNQRQSGYEPYNFKLCKREYWQSPYILVRLDVWICKYTRASACLCLPARSLRLGYNLFVCYAFCTKNSSKSMKVQARKIILMKQTNRWQRQEWGE